MWFYCGTWVFNDILLVDGMAWKGENGGCEPLWKGNYVFDQCGET